MSRITLLSTAGAIALAGALTAFGPSVVAQAATPMPVVSSQIAQLVPASAEDYARGLRAGYRQGHADGMKDGMSACQRRGRHHSDFRLQNQGDYERGLAEGYTKGYDSGFAFGCRRAEHGGRGGWDPDHPWGHGGRH
jgi:hypothetical protein